MMQKFLCLSMVVLSITSAYAEQAVLKNDPNRPVESIGQDLGVSAEQFVACFNRVHPTPGGNRPESSKRVLANKSVLLPCLQKANPSITNDKLDEVMDRYRPGGRKAQQPMQ